MQSTRTNTAADPVRLYDEDFFEWTRHNADLLRAGRFEQADIEHIAEEIEDMGKRDLRGLDNRVQVLLSRLMKWQLQPAKRSPSWQHTIAVQRAKLEQILADSPSLRQKAGANLQTNHLKAVQFSAIETGIPEGQFPPEFPYTIEQILNPDFLP